jgi:beta-glucuronidase
VPEVPLLRSSLLALIGLIVLLVAATPADAARYRAVTPPDTQITQDGADGRYLLSGDWLQKRDPSDKGQKRRWFRQTGTGGWAQVTVPNAFNAGDPSPESQSGSVVWYRKDFKVPSKSKSLDWIVRFESTRYRADVYLNGKLMNSHDGGYLPFEVRLTGVNPKGTNRLVVRVDNRRRATDLPPSVVTIDGAPGGGWWNYGGILADVYLRKVDRLDFGDPVVRPTLPARGGPARVEYSVPVVNYGKKPVKTTVQTTFGGQPLKLGTKKINPGQTQTFTGSIDVAQPHLWNPSDPFLYPVDIQAKAGSRALAGYKLHSGIRSLTVRNGRLYQNDLPADLRGGFIHLDDPARGGAVTPEEQQAYITRLKSVGGTVLRTHYPFPPLMQELADRMGVMLWSELPVYQVPSKTLGKTEVRREALSQLEEEISQLQNHPSVFTWSLGNELNPQPTIAEKRWFDQGSELAKRLDPTRPVSLAIQGYPTQGPQSAYEPFDLIGINDYFGWYPGPGGSIADRDSLSGYLDAIRGWYPAKALMITEFGAEANRPGPFEERGTYDFQSDWLDYHLSVYATKPWLSGAVTMLQEFWCRPAWSGGNPKPQSPVHQKGIFDMTGNAKPAAAVISDWYHRTQQFDIPEGGG